MSSPNMTKDEQKAASPAAETEGQAEIRALKAKVAELEAAAAAATAATSEAKSSAESAAKPVAEPPVKPPPGPASSSTPATGGSAVNKSGYFESGEWPPTDSKLHPPQQRQRLQKPAPRPPQSKKTSTQGRVAQPAAEESEKKVEEQQELGKTEHRVSLGGYEITSGAKKGLAGSKHAPGKTAPRQTPQPRGQGRGNRGRGGHARGGAVIKKEEGETGGVQIRGASQRGRSGMLPPSRPPPHQTPVPVASPPGQQPCHMPFCSGNLTIYTPVCPLCGTPRQERQEPSMHGAQPPPYQQWGSSALNPYASSALASYGSSPSPVPQPYSSYSQFPGQPPFSYPSWWAPPPSPFGFPGYTAPSPARDSVTPAPLATGSSQGVKRERSPSSSFHGESQPPRLSKRARKKMRQAELRSTSTVLPSIETPEPQQTPRPPQLSQPRQTPRPPQQQLLYTSRTWSAPTASSSNSPDVAQIRHTRDAVLKQYEAEIAKAAAVLAQRQAQAAPSPSMPPSTNATASPSVPEVAQQLPTSEPEKSNEKAEQPANSASENGEKKVEQQPADSASENGDKMDSAEEPPPQQPHDTVFQEEVFNHLTLLTKEITDWYDATRTEIQNFTDARLADVESQVRFVIQHHQLPPASFGSILNLFRWNCRVMRDLVQECHHSRTNRVLNAFTCVRTVSAQELERIYLNVQQLDQEDIVGFGRLRDRRGLEFTLALNDQPDMPNFQTALRQAAAASAPPPAISQPPLPAIMPVAHQPEQSTALIPREDRAIVPVDEPSHRIDELEYDGENVRMEGGEATSASPSTGNTSLVRRRIEGRPPYVSHEEKRLQKMAKKNL